MFSICSYKMPRKYLRLADAVAAILADSSSDSDDEASPEICILPPDNGDNGGDTDIEGIDDDNLLPDEPPDVCGELHVFRGADDTDVASSVSESVCGTDVENNVMSECTHRKRSSSKTSSAEAVDTEVCHRRRGKVRKSSECAALASTATTMTRSQKVWEALTCLIVCCQPTDPK